MNKNLVWIGVAIAALFGIWWVYKTRTATPARSGVSSNNAGLNYGAEGNLPAWRFGADPSVIGGHTGPDRFGGDNNNLPDSGLSYSTATGTWTDNSVDRRFN